MIELSIDCAFEPKMNVRADYNRFCIKSRTVEEFTENCGAELQVALIGVIVKAEDEYARIIQTKCKRKMTEEERLSIGGFLMDYVKEIDEEKVLEFRKDVMGKGKQPSGKKENEQ